MVKLIVGSKGSGKTKRLVEMVRKSADTSKGNVICIEKGDARRYDLNYKIRLINIEEYKISGVPAYYGFIAGLMAGNYDITEIYGDATFRILCGKDGKDFEALARFVERLSALVKGMDLDIILTVSCDASDLPDSLREYCI